MGKGNHIADFAGGIMGVFVLIGIGVAAPISLGDDAEVSVGKPVLPQAGEFSLRGVDGDPLTAADMAGHKAVVIFFIDVLCPLANGYAPEMLRIKEDYSEKGVGVFGVYPDPELGVEKAVEHGREYSLSFRRYLDPEQTLARRLGVTIVPEVAVLLPSGQLKYRGRIDNWYSLDGKRRLKATRHDLRAALDAVLAGEDPDPAITEAYGCYLPEPTKR